jgi:Type I phosphodiesterase / nucleotide pyrophosphatase
MPSKLVLVVVDGMTPAAFERAVGGGRAPALSFLAARGDYRRATSVFPSLTPVCITSIATGAGPGVHHIPSLVWWSRQERRIVEYGSSFAAIRAAGLSQSLLDTIFNMNERHLAGDAVTIYEALEDAGLVAGAVNITCYRGRHRYLPTVPGLHRAVHGPRRFFFYGLFESDRTGAPFAVRSRRAGSVDAYAAAAGRWLVTRDGFDFLAYYLSGYDFASHESGPDGAAANDALEQADAAIGALLEAAGGPDEFLERYAVVLFSDHGQTAVERSARLEEPFADLAHDVVVAASNRAGQVYLLPHARIEAAELARRLDAEPAVETALWREGGEAVARRAGEELRFRPAESGRWETSGDVSLLDQPDALARVWSALANPNAGELLVSAAEGWELADLGGRHHAGGGSHGSLAAGDSLVPLVTIGLRAEPRRITEVAPAVLEHFGVAVPGAMEGPLRVG